jgi:hypothetical protein
VTGRGGAVPTNVRSRPRTSPRATISSRHSFSQSSRTCSAENACSSTLVKSSQEVDCSSDVSRATLASDSRPGSDSGSPRMSRLEASTARCSASRRRALVGPLSLSAVVRSIPECRVCILALARPSSVSGCVSVTWGGWTRSSALHRRGRLVRHPRERAGRVGGLFPGPLAAPAMVW